MVAGTHNIIRTSQYHSNNLRIQLHYYGNKSKTRMGTQNLQ